MKELLATLHEEAFAEIEAARSGVLRAVTLPQTKEMISVLIGIRRAGKTYTLYQKIHSLLDQGISKDRILFIDFEDDRLYPMDATKMAQLLDEFYATFPENYDRKCYLFLDEVQAVENWHQVIRRVFKSKDTELTLTGSSAKLLSSEINTSLRGRSLSTEIWPYSFAEYQRAHEMVPLQPPFSRRKYDLKLKHLTQFFNIGGFPAVQQMQRRDWRNTLQNYVDTVILRDIIERYGVTNTALLKYLTKTLLVNAGTLFSVNKFYNDIKSQGYKIGRETLHHYMNYLEDAFLIFKIPLYSESVRVRQTQPYKIYAIDNGLINAYSITSKAIFHKHLENQVYLDLRRQGKEIYYYNTQEGYEIDFVTIDPEGNRELLQVTWDMSESKTAEREMRALETAEKELGIKGRIITAREYAAETL